MERHHQESIEQFVARYEHDTSVVGLLLGGSIAHGFAAPDSDIDILIVVEEPEYQARKQANTLAFSVRDVCTYPGGYVDCKVVSLSFLAMVAERGSDPARYAFQDSKVLLSRVDDLEGLVKAISVFPIHEKDTRRKRFVAQLLAWRWFYSESVRKQSHYLHHLSVHKLALFSCRLVLNENNLLYPYHKWLLPEVRRAPRKPDDFDALLDQVLSSSTSENVELLCDRVLDFVQLNEQSVHWPNLFLVDSELNWMEHEAPIDDI